MKEFWSSIKEAIIWLGIIVGLVLGIVGIRQVFDLSRLETVTGFGFLCIALLLVVQLKRLSDIAEILKGREAQGGNPVSKPSPEEKPSGGGVVGGGLIGGIAGSLIAPGLGTIIGAIIGALIGNKIEYDEIQKKKRRKR